MKTQKTANQVQVGEYISQASGYGWNDFELRKVVSIKKDTVMRGVFITTQLTSGKTMTLRYDKTHRLWTAQAAN